MVPTHFFVRNSEVRHSKNFKAALDSYFCNDLPLQHVAISTRIAIEKFWPASQFCRQSLRRVICVASSLLTRLNSLNLDGLKLQTKMKD